MSSGSTTLHCDNCHFKTPHKQGTDSTVTLFRHQLFRHMKLPTDYRSICDECGKAYLVIKKGDLWRHHFTKHTKWTAGEGHYCHDCGHQSPTVFALRTHTVVKHLLGNQKVISCDTCGKGLKNRKDAVVHLQICQLAEVKVKCQLCSMQVAANYLSKHVKHKHRSVKIDCEECDRQFDQRPSMAAHWMSVHGGIRVTCHKCGRGYQLASSLKFHVHHKH